MKNQQEVNRAFIRAKKSQGEELSNDASAESNKNPRSAIYSQLSDEMRDCLYAANSSQMAPRIWDEVFTPQDKVLLGRTLEEAYETFGDITEMRVKVRGGTLPRAAVEMLAALEVISPKKRRSLLQQLGEEGEDSEATMEIAKQSGCLVLADGPREVYWEKSKIDIDWENNSKLWEYFLAVCKAAKGGNQVDSLTFEGGKTRTNRKSRLLKDKGFPPTLAARFGSKATANMLNLLPGEIRIFEQTVYEELTEWGAERIRRG